MLNIYFKNAYKIIAITENVKRYNMNLFDIPEDKYLVINNSINLGLFNNFKNELIFPIRKFLLISRLSKEKEQSIKNGIELFAEYSKNQSKCSLRIAGSGPSLEELKNYIEERNYKNIEFIGRSSEIAKEIANADIVLGLGRCIIEAMASQKICCIIGYDKIKPIIKKENIEQAMFENFSGRGLPDETIDSIVEQITEMKEEQLREIVYENYVFVKDKLDLEKNIYIADKNEKTNYKNIIIQLFEFIGKIQIERDTHKREKDEIWEGKLWLENQYNIQKELLERKKIDN